MHIVRLLIKFDYILRNYLQQVDHQPWMVYVNSSNFLIKLHTICEFGKDDSRLLLISLVLHSCKLQLLHKKIHYIRVDSQLHDTLSKTIQKQKVIIFQSLHIFVTYKMLSTNIINHPNELSALLDAKRNIWKSENRTN